MDEPKPKKPWWRKRRWAAALSALLLVAYPASQGPATYLLARGWLTREPFLAAYGPLAFVPYPPPLERCLGVYLTWWRDKAWRDTGRLPSPVRSAGYTD